ncbi:MAG: hypothetical protein C0594_14375 [Marinilabiliales bacterium]|nr:MAG: hypothetical protein C0594_14375 [Marinilabiliales bacterium]
MYIDYNTWETFEYKLSTLRLDIKNPRVRFTGNALNQTQIMQFLIENEKVYDLAKKISEEGYFVGEEPIICIEGNKKIVLEGNRRTAALKLLKEPKKYLTAAKANTLIKNCIENGFQVDRKLKCWIAPNRLMANPIIYERHNGYTLHKWKTGNQYSFVAEMYYEDGLSIEDICDVLNETRARVVRPLKAYNLFYEGKEILASCDNIILEVGDFEFTNLERLYTYEDARKIIGVEFSQDNGELNITLPRPEFEKRIRVVFKRLIDAEGFSREFNKEEDKKKFVSELENHSDFDFSIQEQDSATVSRTKENRASLDQEKAKTTTRRRRRSKKQFQQFIIDREIEIVFDNDKLDSLFTELKNLPIDKKYSFAILLRTYLEQVLYYYIETKSLLDDTGTKSNEERRKNGLTKVNTLIAHIKGKYKVSEEIDPEPIMSILKFNIDKEYVSGLKVMLDYIIKNELDDHFDPVTLKNIKHFIERIKDGLDLAVHNLKTLIDVEHNKRAWEHLLPLFQVFSNNILIEEE